MQPIEKLKTCRKSDKEAAAKINELVDRVNLLSSLEAGRGLRLTTSDSKLLLELGTLTGELTCDEGGGGTIVINGS